MALADALAGEAASDAAAALQQSERVRRLVDDVLTTLQRLLPPSAASAASAATASTSTAPSATARAATALSALRDSPTGFARDGRAAHRQLAAFGARANARRAARALAYVLSSDGNPRPRSSEARRRLKAFVSSLRVAMPAAPTLEGMHSFSVLTPMYKETVLFSRSALAEEDCDGRSLLSVLQTLYADEWCHFCERTGTPAAAAAASLGALPASQEQAVRVWASNRGQTLCRTAHGMMEYEAALSFQAALEALPVRRPAPPAPRSNLQDRANTSRCSLNP